MAHHITDKFLSTSKTPCHLLSLPAELREIIWTFAYNLETIETSVHCLSLRSILAIPKAILPDEDSQRRSPQLGLPIWLTTCRQLLGEGSQRRPPQLGLPIWLTTCRQLLDEGMKVLSREYVFTSALFPFQGMRVVKPLRERYVFNRLVFAAISTVVLGMQNESFIKDAGLLELIDEADFKVPTGLNFARWYTCPVQEEEPAVSGTYRVRRHRMNHSSTSWKKDSLYNQLLRSAKAGVNAVVVVRHHQTLLLKLGPTDWGMLNTLNEAGAAVKEIRMRWRYCVCSILPGEKKETLDRWTEKLDYVSIRADGEVEEFAAGIAEELVQRARRRLVAGEGGGREEDGMKGEKESNVSWGKTTRKDHNGLLGYGCMTKHVAVRG